MNKRLLCLGIGWLAIAFTALAQTALLDQQVTIRRTNATAQEVLQELSARYHIAFSYGNDLVPLQQQVHIEAESQPLRQVLDKLLQNTRTRYTVIGSQIILQPVKKEQKEKFTISGHVTDAASGEALAGAVVAVRELPEIGVSANNYGFYSLTVPAGDYTLLVSYLGYSATQQPVRLQENRQLELALFSANMQLAEVSVTAAEADARISDIRTGAHVLPIETIKAMPSFGGEPDVLKGLQLLPGVQAANEGTTNLSVRGGSYDQNLILLDEAPVYNPSHALGFFSVFNADAIQQVDIYKGGIPTPYGGRLSSVVDVRMKEGNGKALKASGSIGLVASQATVEGPWKKAAGSFMLSGRYSYVGQTVNGVGNLAQKVLHIYSFNNFNKGNEINFYDVNAKGNWQFNKKNRLYLSAYTGKDHFYYIDLNANSSMDWGNTTATLRLNHIHSDKLFSNTTLLFSRYHYAYVLKDGANFYSWSSNLRETDAKTDFDYYPTPHHHIRFGAALNYHSFMPGQVEPGTDDAPVRSVRLDKAQALEPVLYLSNEQQLTDRLALDYGLRYAPFLTLGPTTSYTYLEESETVKDSTLYSAGDVAKIYQALEPRLSVRYRLRDQSSVKASFTRTTQYLHLVSNSSVGLPTDVWLPSNRNIRPQRAEQVAAGYFRNFKENLWESSVEVYYKRMHHVVDYKDNADLFLNRHIETQMRVGKGWGYGTEFLLRKNKGLTTGWLSYTWSVARRDIVGVNNNQPYDAPFDKRHNVSLTAAHQLSQRVQLSSNFVYSTGKAATVPQGTYAWDQTVFVYYSERNGYRLPAYHRLDLSLTLQGRKNSARYWKSNWVFGVYNVYGRKNIFSLYIKQEDYTLTTLQAYRTYLFGVVPSVTYNIHM